MINRISDNFNKYIKNTNIMDLLHMWTIEYYDYLSKQKNFYNDIPKIIRLDKRYNYRNDTYMKSKSVVGTYGNYHQQDLAITINGSRRFHEYKNGHMGPKTCLPSISPQLQIWFKVFKVCARNLDIDKIYREVYEDANNLIDYFYNILKDWIYDNLEISKDNYAIEFYKCYNENNVEPIIKNPNIYYIPYIMFPFVNPQNIKDYHYRKTAPAAGIVRAIMFPSLNLTIYNDDSYEDYNKTIDDNIDSFIENFNAPKIIPKSIVIGNIANALTVCVRSKKDNKIVFMFQYHKENFNCKVITDTFMFYDVIGFKRVTNATEKINMDNKVLVEYNDTKETLQKLKDTRRKILNKKFEEEHKGVMNYIYDIVNEYFSKALSEKYNSLPLSDIFKRDYCRKPLVTTDLKLNMRTTSKQAFFRQKILFTIHLPPFDKLYTLSETAYCNEFAKYTNDYDFTGLTIEIFNYYGDEHFKDISLIIYENEQYTYDTLMRFDKNNAKRYKQHWPLLHFKKIIYHNNYDVTKDFLTLLTYLVNVPIYKDFLISMCNNKDFHKELIKLVLEARIRTFDSDATSEYLNSVKKLENKLYRLQCKGKSTYGKLKNMSKLNDYENLDNLFIELNYYYDNKINMIAKRVGDDSYV